jgi:tetratricopeptide (TPR) repeat protein
MLQSGSVGKNVRLLLELWWKPAAAMSAILDGGSLLFACLAALAVALLEGGYPLGYYVPLLLLAAAYVPGVLLIASLLGRLAGFAPDFRRDYSPLLTCIAMAWTAANLPLLLAVRLTGTPVIALALVAACLLYFTVLVFFAVRTVFGASNGAAAAAAVLSWVPMIAVAVAWGPIRMVLAWVASPFFLFFAWYYLGGEFAGLGAGLRERQNFRRMLEASAINPHDGDAQYQLGLIYQQRRQYTEAMRRFSNAVAIDPTEADAHFQLGRISRDQGRTDDALAHFREVLRLDEKHSLSEIHREAGAAWLAAGSLQEARRELAIYTDRRTHDPEGLWYYGQTLEGLGDQAEAREMYQRAVEAARTAPRYIRRTTARWSRLAQKQLRHLTAHPTSTAP